ncbi:MAG: tetratricopeptide repeat protein, partial [Planctomycetota bacterium]
MRPSRLARAAAAALLAGCAAPAAREPANLQFLREAEKHFLLEEYGRAAGYYEAFLNDNPGHPDRAEILTRLGRCHLGAGRPDLALAAFEKALAEKPSGPLRWELLFRRAVAWRLSGDAARAVEGFRSLASAPA